MAVPLDGSAPRNITNGAGAKGEIRFRYVRIEPADARGRRPGGGLVAAADAAAAARRGRSISSKPITLSAYGE